MQRIENICSSFSYFFLSTPRIFLTYLPPFLFPLPLYHPSSSFPLGKYTRIPSETKLVETDHVGRSVLRISFTLASSKEYPVEQRHGRRVVAPRNIRDSVSPRREKERER